MSKNERVDSEIAPIYNMIALAELRHNLNSLLSLEDRVNFAIASRKISEYEVLSMKNTIEDLVLINKQKEEDIKNLHNHISFLRQNMNLTLVVPPRTILTLGAVVGIGIYFLCMRR